MITAVSEAPLQFSILLFLTVQAFNNWFTFWNLSKYTVLRIMVRRLQSSFFTTLRCGYVIPLTLLNYKHALSSLILKNNIHCKIEFFFLLHMLLPTFQAEWSMYIVPKHYKVLCQHTHTHTHNELLKIQHQSSIHLSEVIFDQVYHCPCTRRITISWKIVAL